ncbi:RagB/SusD family nutrient uptake outer membrane protein [Pedobacter cryotolerans]|uniref:RagB/SusD family nutrient uptake outer membrane protein n=1 Tax=Pedobacter cryotolerans TaxID=2571270 RepID=A0A4U1C0U1_9SPHI|nr:RagB/SusD family nutrient uptake outer membrane protein [Pedobacter cryotolerans]TKB96609.1 RagB/SusD family nutrient uptake outer membrane protein [Pedobacter cryotolerans]
MKLFKAIFFITTALGALSLSSCKKLLEENQRTALSQDYLASPAGIIAGVTGAYSDMRFLWGTEGFSVQTAGGTDEVLAGASAGGSTNTLNYTNLASLSNDYAPTFQISYQDINTLNGVLQFGPAASFPTEIEKTQALAQAKFMRAFLYYNLIITFGNIPLNKTFITIPSAAAAPSPRAEIYDFIIKDLTEAAVELQNVPTAPFLGKAATRATALYLLAKVYSTRGFSDVAQPTDFQMAASTAQNLIDNKTTYGVDLWQDYADAHKPGNEYGKETLFVVDYNNDPRFGEFVPGASGGRSNGTAYFQRPNYPTVNANYPSTGGSAVMTRDIANGRPFIRMRPNTSYVINTAFTNVVEDTRYYKTFQTVWIANTAGITTPRGALTVGTDTAIWMPPFEVTAARRAAFKGVIFTPTGANGANAYTDVFYPSMKKYDDPNRPAVNDPSTRPFVMFRFADVYLIAAEAYHKANNNAKAAEMINVLRTRAAFSTTRTAAQNTAAALALQITASDINLDFILNERTRELYGEHLRWWDLARTKSLIQRVTTYNAQARPNIRDFHILRPIPQRQIDLVTSGPAYPQNTGYN